MDVLDAIKGRRSCRAFLTEEVERGQIEKLLEAAVRAPSPLNSQPWEFIVILRKDIKEKIHAEATRCKQWALEKSGWKWLAKYDAEFLKTVPAIIAVVGDPKGTGVDMFLEEGSTGYQHACAAAIQNILLAAHAMGLAGLWFTFFDKKAMRGILGVDDKKMPIGLVCIGKPAGETSPMPRKSFLDKTTWL
ncbi:MAG: hypothetical protein COZ70_14260 [Deltaproteobacteria bacterium CG_4_8_14_3_um_filter_51_11]|nr:hypothetical protein [bacterium]OIP42838.1 MAG: hypothetical protein AUK25_02895 [Desulfobacteraceae bacterium CG2_30_51_40]PIP44874.1 MAG: hypothetical protein COX16_16205 [Deltaproteobacteria bacterium CG23_combo_of_CG06-09_8_20_14_all_51_20]PIW00457.1 MAG: hypothetical protein COW41_05380 [Deltaproteobacteria bacterium CG17_big_fil_post_rev_8_21_14_2_50_51_6]PIX18419.1 MAG: hypothetical protein COZ70_14260 [Deltaproteobacteria bacterium CG_4_8_14_3_um_filter_51_11]PJB37490.1 MAG: hypothe